MVFSYLVHQVITHYIKVIQYRAARRQLFVLGLRLRLSRELKQV